MANPEHIEMVLRGYSKFNTWKKGLGRRARIDLEWAHLDGFDFQFYDLSGANMRGATLNGASMRRCNLSRTYLLEAELRGVNFYDTDLTNTFLFDAWLTSAHFCGAKAKNTNFTWARLDNADLRDANFENARISAMQIAECVNVEYAIQLPAQANLACAVLCGYVLMKDRPPQPTKINPTQVIGGQTSSFEDDDD